MGEKFRSWKTEEWVLTDVADQESRTLNQRKPERSMVSTSDPTRQESRADGSGGLCKRRWRWRRGVGGCSKSVQEEINAPEPHLTPCSSPSQLRQKSELFSAGWGTPGPSEHERFVQNKGSVHNTGVLFSHLVHKMLAAGRFSMAGNWGSPFHGTRRGQEAMP